MADDDAAGGGSEWASRTLPGQDKLQRLQESLARRRAGQGLTRQRSRATHTVHRSRAGFRAVAVDSACTSLPAHTRLAHKDILAIMRDPSSETFRNTLSVARAARGDVPLEDEQAAHEAAAEAEGGRLQDTVRDAAQSMRRVHRLARPKWAVDGSGTAQRALAPTVAALRKAQTGKVKLSRASRAMMDRVVGQGTGNFLERMQVKERERLGKLGEAARLLESLASKQRAAAPKWGDVGPGFLARMEKAQEERDARIAAARAAQLAVPPRARRVFNPETGRSEAAPPARVKWGDVSEGFHARMDAAQSARQSARSKAAALAEARAEGGGPGGGADGAALNISPDFLKDFNVRAASSPAARHRQVR